MFIILAYQRSGTHLLASLLNSHSGLRCYDEVLLGNGYPNHLGVKPIPELKEHEGAIVMYNHYLENKPDLSQAKIIHLMRRDLNNQARSKIKLDDDRSEEQIIEDIQNKREKVFQNNFQSVFEIYYEDITGNCHVSEYENPELLKYLGVKPEKLTTNTVKGNVWDSRIQVKR